LLGALQAIAGEIDDDIGIKCGDLLTEVLGGLFGVSI
jgi:hypothetical protein